MPKFSTILIDSPWPERGGGRIKRGADRHYETINRYSELLRVIMQAPVWRPADDCHLYCWVTDNYEPWYHELVVALGFTHKRSLPWVKTGPAGIGQYFLGTHELLKFAVRGKGFAVKTETRKLRTDALVGIPRVTDARGNRIHSAKPEEQYALIESRSKGPYLEMFARRHRPGWTCWGNELKAEGETSTDPQSGPSA